MRKYYDALFADLDGTKMYHEFLNKHLIEGSLLEFACGTGDLLKLLSVDHDVVGIDLDVSMIQQAYDKYPQLKENIKFGNFLDYSSDEKFDNLVCVGDSLNYMQDINELKQFVKNSVELSDHIIVDFHHPYRLKEFEDEYYEEGSTETFDYMYMIQTNEDFLIHTINFMDGTFDTVIQWVFMPEVLINEFEKYGYSAEIYTDFDQVGISFEGEKLMCIFKKVNV